MKIVFLVIGKTSERWIEDGMNVFLKRLKHYQKTEFHALPDVKGGGKMSPEALKEAEAAVYEKFIESTDTKFYFYYYIIIDKSYLEKFFFSILIVFNFDMF